MTILTSSATFTISDGSVATESTTLLTLPAVASANGKGRLIHPTLGTYDYAYAPDQWTNIDGDVIIAPAWSHSKTLDGAVNSLWPGNIRQVEVFEKWSVADGLAMPVQMLRMLISFWTNAPDPLYGKVQWWPNYVSTLGYEVAMVSLTSGGEGITLNHIIFNEAGFVNFDVELKMRILGRV